MDRTVAQANIDRFRKQLAEETDEVTRQTLHRLLAEEKAKLANPTATQERAALERSTK